MSKIIKVLLTICLILTLGINFYFVQATSDDQLADSNVSDEDSTQNNKVVNETPHSPSASDALSSSSVTKVSNVNSYEQANLQLNNILCIILIAVAVVLILFAIAILIRLNK